MSVLDKIITLRENRTTSAIVFFSRMRTVIMTLPLSDNKLYQRGIIFLPRTGIKVIILKEPPPGKLSVNSFKVVFLG